MNRPRMAESTRVSLDVLTAGDRSEHLVRAGAVFSGVAHLAYSKMHRVFISRLS